METLIRIIRAVDNRPREAAEALAKRWIAGVPIHPSWFIEVPGIAAYVAAAR